MEILVVFSCASIFICVLVWVERSNEKKYRKRMIEIMGEDKVVVSFSMTPIGEEEYNLDINFTERDGNHKYSYVISKTKSEIPNNKTTLIYRLSEMLVDRYRKLSQHLVWT